jgi:hypothetical protein
MVAPSVSPTPANSAIAPSPAATPEPTLISDHGIGHARLGMTLGELKQALGAETQFQIKSPFIVDFDAIAVQKAGAVQYYILYLAKHQFGDRDAIQGLLTENANFRTASGVGPGTPIQQAEQAYGKATLSYSTSNESREYVRFARHPAPNISFGTGNANQQTAGVYTSPLGEYNETQKFKENAKIQSVLVVCLTEACARP